MHLSELIDLDLAGVHLARQEMHRLGIEIQAGSLEFDLVGDFVERCECRQFR